MTTQARIKKLKEMPPELQKEAMDYIEFLMHKYKTKKPSEKFGFDWEGGLSELKGKYTSVKLQHKALDWR
jgi:hypothetical protein